MCTGPTRPERGEKKNGITNEATKRPPLGHSIPRRRREEKCTWEHCNPVCRQRRLLHLVIETNEGQANGVCIRNGLLLLAFYRLLLLAASQCQIGDYVCAAFSLLGVCSEAPCPLCKNRFMGVWYYQHVTQWTNLQISSKLYVQFHWSGGGVCVGGFSALLRLFYNIFKLICVMH